MSASRIVAVGCPFSANFSPIPPNTSRSSERSREEPTVRLSMSAGMTTARDSVDVGRTSSSSLSASRRTLSAESRSAAAKPIAIASVLRPAFCMSSPISPNASMAFWRTRSDESWRLSMSAGTTMATDSGDVGCTSSSSSIASLRTFSEVSRSAAAKPAAMASVLRPAFRSRSPIAPNTSTAFRRTRSDESLSISVRAAAEGVPSSLRKSRNCPFTALGSSASVGTNCASNSACQIALSFSCLALSALNFSVSWANSSPRASAVPVSNCGL